MYPSKQQSRLMSASSLIVLIMMFSAVHSFDLNSKNNLVAYWGQNSASSHGYTQTMLGDYCNDNTYDVIMVSFLNTFFTNNFIPNTNISLPGLNLANLCWNTFPSYPALMSCPDVGTSVAKCQSAGKIVLLSLGGAIGTYGFANSSQAQQFATTVWNMFLGGTDSSYPRPFGSQSLDGVDLDIEGGSTSFYDVFVNALSSLYESRGSKKYYISAAPQCVYPDAHIGPSTGSALSTGKLDFINIQFYNNPCGLASGSSFNYNTWSSWITSNSPNTKIFIGAPADTYAAGSGYLTAPNLKALVANYINNTNFGGVMLWDLPTAQANNVSATQNFAQYISSYLKSANPGTTTTTTSSVTTTNTTTTSASTTATSSPTTTSTSSPTTTSDTSTNSTASSTTSTSSATTATLTTSPSSDDSETSYAFKITNLSSQFTFLVVLLSVVLFY